MKTLQLLSAGPRRQASARTSAESDDVCVCVCVLLLCFYPTLKWYLFFIAFAFWKISNCLHPLFRHLPNFRTLQKVMCIWFSHRLVCLVGCKRMVLSGVLIDLTFSHSPPLPPSVTHSGTARDVELIVKPPSRCRCGERQTFSSFTSRGFHLLSTKSQSPSFIPLGIYPYATVC